MNKAEDYFAELGSSGDEFRKLVELRTELEVLAARHAVKRGEARERMGLKLDEALAALRKATRRKDHAGFDEADRRLHATIVEAGGGRCLAKCWEQVWKELEEFHRRSLKTHWPDLRVLMGEHAYLVEALKSGDAVAVEDGLRTHLQAIWFRVAEERGELGGQDDPLTRATAYLAFHFHRAVRLETLAREVAFVSAGHLSRLFREEYGTSFVGYVQGLRLEKAAALLEATMLPVAQIGARVGYADISRFGQHFRRRFKMTPRAWRGRSRGARDERG